MKIFNIILIVLYMFNSTYSQNEKIILPTGNSDEVVSIAVSPDKKYLVATTKNSANTIVWDLEKKMRIKHYNANRKWVTDVDFNRDGSLFLTASWDGEICFYDMSSESLPDKPSCGKIYPNLIHSAKFSFDGKKIISSSNSIPSNVVIMDVKTKKIKRYPIDFSPHKALLNKDNSFFVVGAYRKNKQGNYTIAVIDTKSNERIKTLVGHTGRIQEILISNDEKYLVSSSTDKTIKVWDLKKGVLIKTLTGHNSEVRSLSFSKNEEYLLSSSRDRSIILWRVKNWEFIKKMEGHNAYVTDVAFIDEKHFASSSLDQTIKIWNLETGKNIYDLKGHVTSIYKARFSPNDQYIYITGGSGRTLNDKSIIPKYSRLRSIDLASLRSKSFKTDGVIKAFAVTPSGKYFLMGSITNNLYLWDVENEKIKIKYKKNPIGGTVTSGDFSHDGKNFITGSNDGTVKLWAVNQKTPLKIFKPHGEKETGIVWVDLSPNGKYCVASSFRNVFLINLKNDRIKTYFNFKLPQLQITRTVGFSNSGELFATYLDSQKKILIWNIKQDSIISTIDADLDYCKQLNFTNDDKEILSSDGFGISLWDIESGNKIKEYNQHNKRVIGAVFSSKDKFILSAGEDHTVKIFDKENEKEIISVLLLDTTDIIFYTNDNYYHGSKNSSKLISFKVENNLFTFDQFDLKYNRPDILIDRLGFASPEKVALFRNAYKKRLQRFNFTIEMLSNDFHVPGIVINTKGIPITTQNQILKFNVFATDSKLNLDRINIWINDVPIYGINGINLRPKNIKSWEQDISLTLSKGENKIQVSALNQGGAESLKETFYITYDAPKEKPNLHIVTIGAESFVDTNFNLSYPLKDLKDFTNLFQENSTNYNSVNIHKLYNNEITKERLKEIKTKLNQSKVDDHVILFVAGHGILDDSLNYYLATPKMDFSNPADGGILYEELENLLDAIPARNKLFLMDACHSGEIDKTEVTFIENKAIKNGNIKFRTSGGDTPKYKKLGLENSFELMRELFVDLRRGTGATIISSASGLEFALESDQWKNSIFTYCLLSGLKEKKADLNKDGKIMVSELQIYLAREVANLTNNLQQPTMRMENVSNDFQIW